MIAFELGGSSGRRWLLPQLGAGVLKQMPIATKSTMQICMSLHGSVLFRITTQARLPKLPSIKSTSCLDQSAVNEIPWVTCLKRAAYSGNVDRNFQWIVFIFKINGLAKNESRSQALLAGLCACSMHDLCYCGNYELLVGVLYG